MHQIRGIIYQNLNAIFYKEKEESIENNKGAIHAHVQSKRLIINSIIMMIIEAFQAK